MFEIQVDRAKDDSQRILRVHEFRDIDPICSEHISGPMDLLAVEPDLGYCRKAIENETARTGVLKIQVEFALVPPIEVVIINSSRTVRVKLSD